jgi:hypothetical protein
MTAMSLINIAIVVLLFASAHARLMLVSLSNTGDGNDQPRTYRYDCMLVIPRGSYLPSANQTVQPLYCLFLSTLMITSVRVETLQPWGKSNITAAVANQVSNGCPTIHGIDAWDEASGHFQPMTDDFMWATGPLVVVARCHTPVLAAAIAGKAFDTRHGLRIGDSLLELSVTSGGAHLGTGLTTWDAAVVLAKYLEKHAPNLVTGKRVRHWILLDSCWHVAMV